MTPEEPDFPPGHPKRADYDPNSPEAKEWKRLHVHVKGERDFPVGHPKADDTTGNLNKVHWEPGVDPFHPELEPFSGHPRLTAPASDPTLAATNSTTAKTEGPSILDAALRAAQSVFKTLEKEI
jgi:hypothetical protein